MAIRYKNPQTGEYEVIKIPVMKGEQGHAGIHVGTDAPPTTDVKLWFDPSDTDNDVDLANRLDTTLTACYDYMGNDRGSIKAAADANVDWLLGEINTVHYDGQHITATDTIEGRSKSAILKGQTLVNLVSNGNVEQEIGYSVQTKAKYRFNKNMINQNKEYLLLFDVSNLTDDIFYISFNHANETGITYITNKSNGIMKVKVNFSNVQGNISDVLIIFHTNSSNKNPSGYINDVMLIPYQQGMENWDIPYFEGMASCKMPVLTTTGKNLFDGTVVGNYYIGGNGELVSISDCYATDYIEIESDTNYCINTPENEITGFYDKDKNFISSVQTKTFLSPSNARFLRTTIKPLSLLDTFQLEEGTTTTTYEPYKSNILTVNEDVELRGIGEVRDTLNLMTGEMTERIGEIVLNGSENWVISQFTRPNHLRLYFTGSKFKQYQNVINSRFPDIGNIQDRDVEGVYITNTFDIQVEHSRLSEVSVVGFKQWLSQNPITVQYRLATESIKTVDLSDYHVYSYKDTTHYTCSSEEGSLVPTLSIDVPTNLPALVTKQRQQIRTLEEENKELNQELELAIASSEESDNELLAQSFELDFRLMEVEFALDLPMAATFRLGGKAMAMTPYEMAKKLILADNYDRADMEHKLEVYVSKKRMTEAERQELIQLMDEKEGVITIDPVEPEVEETVIEHEAVVIPLH